MQRFKKSNVAAELSVTNVRVPSFQKETKMPPSPQVLYPRILE